MTKSAGIHGQHSIKGLSILILEKLISKELCQILNSSSTNNSTSITHFEIIFHTNNLDGTKNINITTCEHVKATSKITKSPLRSYCNTYVKTPIHLFCVCNSTDICGYNYKRDTSTVI